MIKRLARRIGSPVPEDPAVRGRLMTERHTRDTKKATKAAAVHGTPSCHPNASTPAAPNANSVSQNDLTRQSSVGSQQSESQEGYCAPAVERGAGPFRYRPMNSSSLVNT